MLTATSTMPFAAKPALSSDKSRRANGVAGLREQVLARLVEHPAWDERTSNVYIHEGDTVVLQGWVRLNGVRAATRRIAEAVPGVRRVWDARVMPREG